MIEKKNGGSIVVLILLTLVGCASFESVTTTAKLAQKFDGHHGLYTRSITVCDYLRVLDSNFLTESYCTGFSKSLKEYEVALTVMEDYGKVLEKVAENTDMKTADKVDIVIKGSEEAEWLKLTDDSKAGVKKVAEAVTKLFINGFKRRNISTVVTEVDPAIQMVVNDYLKKEFANRRIAYARLSEQLKQLSSEPATARPDKRVVSGKDGLFAEYNELDMLTILHLQALIEQDLKDLDACEKVLTAFAAAHHKLAADARKIGTKQDKEILKEIFSSIKDIYKGVDKIE
jgi:hypothetical protein